MKFLTSGASVVQYARGDVYYLLGEHIIGVYWDDVTTVVYNAGTTAAPTPAVDLDPYDMGLRYHLFDNTSLLGISRAEAPGRVGLWCATKLVVLQFSDPDGATLEVTSTDEYPYQDNILGGPMSGDVQYVLESRGRPFFEFYGWTVLSDLESQYGVSAVGADGRADLYRHSVVDANGWGVYGGVITTPNIPI